MRWKSGQLTRINLNHDRKVLFWLYVKTGSYLCLHILHLVVITISTSTSNRRPWCSSRFSLLVPCLPFSHHLHPPKMGTLTTWQLHSTTTRATISWWDEELPSVRNWQFKFVLIVKMLIVLTPTRSVVQRACFGWPRTKRQNKRAGITHVDIMLAA